MPLILCLKQTLSNRFDFIISDKSGGGAGGDKDPCHPNPCLNGGTCKQNGNGFDCMCEVQYTGSVCEGIYDLINNILINKSIFHLNQIFKICSN